MVSLIVVHALKALALALALVLALYILSNSITNQNIYKSRVPKGHSLTLCIAIYSVDPVICDYQSF